MIEINVQLMILNQDKTKGHLKFQLNNLPNLVTCCMFKPIKSLFLYISQCDLIIVKACTSFIYKLLVNLKFSFCKQKKMSKC